MNFYHISKQNLDQKVVPQQNTVRLEKTNYASPGNFTPAVLVMLKTFRRSEINLHRTPDDISDLKATFLFAMELSAAGPYQMISGVWVAN